MRARASAHVLPLVLSAMMVGCGSSQELTQARKDYDDMCARGHNVWRMFYHGTDSAYHHFLVNDMDRWANVRIAKSEIMMAEPLPVSDTTRTYYCVDPCAGWTRAKGACWLGPAAPARQGP